nr:hypothetical protein [Streptomyces sp. SID486]
MCERFGVLRPTMSEALEKLEVGRMAV